MMELMPSATIGLDSKDYKVFGKYGARYAFTIHSEKDVADLFSLARERLEEIKEDSPQPFLVYLHAYQDMMMEEMNEFVDFMDWMDSDGDGAPMKWGLGKNDFAKGKCSATFFYAKEPAPRTLCEKFLQLCGIR